MKISNIYHFLVDHITFSFIARSVIIFLGLLILAFIINASFEKAMRSIVHKIPPAFFWSYESITPLQDEYKVGDMVTFTSKNTRLIPMRIVWHDYLFCNSDKEAGQLEERYLYISTFHGPRGTKEADWVYGKTKHNSGYKLQREGKDCYIHSFQIGLPYGEELEQEYLSGPFNITK